MRSFTMIRLDFPLDIFQSACFVVVGKESSMSAEMYLYDLIQNTEKGRFPVLALFSRAATSY